MQISALFEGHGTDLTQAIRTVVKLQNATLRGDARAALRAQLIELEAEIVKLKMLRF